MVQSSIPVLLLLLLVPSSPATTAAAAAASRQLQEQQHGAALFILDGSALPCTKPALWPNPRTLASGAAWSIKRQPGTNASRLLVQHDPIAGVTPQMMVWLFQNFDKRAADPRNGQLHQIYVLMHPSDNAAFAYSTPQLRINTTHPTAGTAYRFSHFYAAGCAARTTAANNNAGRPSVTCPPQARRPLFTCATPRAAIAAASSVVERFYFAQRLDTTGFAAVVTLAGHVKTRVLYSWRDTPAGLQITQDVVLGFEDSTAWAAVNTKGLPVLLARATGGDVDLAIAQIALHEIEIVGWYPQWLPRVYRDAAGKAASD